MKQLITVLVLLFTVNSFSQTLAFPCAMGAGAYVTGGRSQTVYHVTNLNATGIGSFRQALADATTNNGGVIVFDVSGVIEMIPEETDGKSIRIGADNLTIAGQSAPQGNITITGAKLKLRGDNVIVRYIKYRSVFNTDGVLQSEHGSDVIFDHISASNVESAEVSIGMTNNLTDVALNRTAQNCLISYSGLGMIIGDSSPPNDTNNDTYSLINNAYVFVGHRIPAKFGGASRIDAVNNLSHGHFSRLIRMDDWSYSLNHVGNYYSSGRGINRLNMAYYGTRNGKIYEHDNFYDPNFTDVQSSNNLGTGIENDPWRDFSQPRTDPLPPSSFIGTSFNYNNFQTLNILNSSDLKTQMLPYTGCYKYISNSGLVVEDRDTIDAMAINDAVNNIQRTSGDVANIRDNFTVNDIPTYNATRPGVNAEPGSFYVSNSHIPEAYLTSRGITGNASIHNQIQPSGYTLIEEYLNQVDACGGTPPVASCSGKNAPVASLTSPIATSYSKSDTLNFGVSYTSDTTVTSVAYYLNGSLLANTTTPFNHNESGLTEGSYTTYAVFTDECGNIANTDTINFTITGLSVDACNMSTPPVIDGLEDAMWSTIPSRVLGVTENGLTMPAPTDVSATYKIAWDATALYIFVSVTDNILFMDSPQLDFFRDDAVSVFIDATDNNSTSYDADDYYIGMKQGNSDIIVNNVLYTGTGISRTSVVTTVGYDMEIKIDWAYLGLTPTVGNDIGLDFRIDDDDDGGSRENHILWNDETSTLWGDPSKFGVLKLTNTSCNNTTTVKNTTEENLVIYPNPTNGKLTIVSDNLINKIEVYNTLGVLVYSEESINAQTKELNLIKLPKGAYSVKVYELDRVVEKQLIKQ